MKHIQKRYIYAAFLASIFFLIIYLLVKINIIISIFLTIAIYYGGILLFKEEDVREFNSENINNYYYLASKVQNEAEKTKNKEIISICENIGKNTDSILVSLSQRPRKVEQIFSFFDYYLDIAYKILYKYNNISGNKDIKESEKKYKENTKDYLQKILDAFEKQSKNMQEAKMLDIDTEIKRIFYTITSGFLFVIVNIICCCFKEVLTNPRGFMSPMSGFIQITYPFVNCDY